MEIKVPLPIKVQVDNDGEIWLTNNSSVSERTEHIDLKPYFVRDMIRDQVIQINFVKSAENDSDIMTKNHQGQHYMYAKSKLVYTVREMRRKPLGTLKMKKQGGCKKARFSYMFPHL